MPPGIRRAKRMRGGSGGLRGSLGQVLPRAGQIMGQDFCSHLWFYILFSINYRIIGQLGHVNYSTKPMNATESANLQMLIGRFACPVCPAYR